MVPRCTPYFMLPISEPLLFTIISVTWNRYVYDCTQKCLILEILRNITIEKRCYLSYTFIVSYRWVSSKMNAYGKSALCILPTLLFIMRQTKFCYLNFFHVLKFSVTSSKCPIKHYYTWYFFADKIK